MSSKACVGAAWARAEQVELLASFTQRRRLDLLDAGPSSTSSPIASASARAAGTVTIVGLEAEPRDARAARTASAQRVVERVQVRHALEVGHLVRATAPCSARP